MKKFVAAEIAELNINETAWGIFNATFEGLLHNPSKGNKGGEGTDKGDDGTTGSDSENTNS